MSAIQPRNYAELRALNNRFQAETSYLEEPDWEARVGDAFLATQYEDHGGFLLAFESRRDFANDNFRWFAKRYSEFVYVDRIVVAETHRGRGVARMLYEDLFDRAAAAGYARVTCEVNKQPPNPGSDAFHARMGFKVVDTVALAGGAKTVRYMLKEF